MKTEKRYTLKRHSLKYYLLTRWGNLFFLFVQRAKDRINGRKVIVRQQTVEEQRRKSELRMRILNQNPTPVEIDEELLWLTTSPDRYCPSKFEALQASADSLAEIRASRKQESNPE